MDVKQIRNMGRELKKFLSQFDDCFGRSEPREHLQSYVRGQLSDLPRKSVEPIALAAGIPPRTLQGFLTLLAWDQQRLRDRLQWMVARDHAHPQAIGVIDETGNPKKGRHTAAVQRQWCGASGKIDNCVIGVHTAYVAGEFQCLLDSDLYLPADWADDPQRRQEASIPEEIEYRKKTTIALEQVARALSNGIRVAAWTFDEWYGRDGQFLDGLDALGQNYVGEIPSDFTGWLREPQVLLSPKPQERAKRGRKRHFPRLSRKALPAGEVRNLLVYSRIFQKQKFKRFRIKDGQNGPMVWEVKSVPFYRKHGPQGLPGPTHTLIIARNVLQPKEVKYFLSNMVIGSEGFSLEWLLWVAFSRWPIERCFEVGKKELGMDHFEVRSWLGIHRHLYISQVSQLFCARIRQKLREKKRPPISIDRRAGSPGRLRLGRSSGSAALSWGHNLSRNFRTDCLSSTSQRSSPKVSPKKDASRPSETGYQSESIEVLCAV